MSMWCLEQVGNELAADKPRRARMTGIVILACVLAIGAVHVVWTAVLSRQWVELFRTEPAVLRLAVAAMAIVGLCELDTCPQTTGDHGALHHGRPHQPPLLSLQHPSSCTGIRRRAQFSGLWFELLSAQATCVVLILAVVGHACQRARRTGGRTTDDNARRRGREHAARGRQRRAGGGRVEVEA